MPYLFAFFLGLVMTLSEPLWAATTSPNSSKILKAQDIEWGYLNPLRGALSPGAANLWGNRTELGATGMLVRFKQGFQSPPHIHNITYRGIVINGLLHNADPQAEKMWMPTGSFWTQPAGMDHITAANGEHNLIYLEIDSGPYLVKPSTQSFDNGERALNQHRDNIVWLDKNRQAGIKVSGVSIAYLWYQDGNQKGYQNRSQESQQEKEVNHSEFGLTGSLLKLEKNTELRLTTEAQEFRAVIISGAINYRSAEQKPVTLKVGSYIESKGDVIHQIRSLTSEPVQIYIRSNAPYQVDG